jgi:hypothetical protein
MLKPGCSGIIVPYQRRLTHDAEFARNRDRNPRQGEKLKLHNIAILGVRMASAATIPITRGKSTVQRTVAAERTAAIAFWTAQMPSASIARIASYAHTSAWSVMKWKKTQVSSAQ